MRSIKVGVPSGKAKMVLWEGTEDENSFEIKSSVHKKPDHRSKYAKRY